MKKLLKRSIAILLAVMITFGSGEYGALFTTDVFAAGGINGTCGKYATYTYSGNQLDIYGKGEISCMFYYNVGSDIKNVIIHDGITDIGDYTFYDCASLSNITIPNSVTSIGTGAFAGCDSLTNIAIPNSATSIGTYTFSGCGSLTNITIPNSVTSIGSSAFYNCTSLTTITIPNSVTSIEKNAFSGCYEMTSVIYDGTCNDWKKIEIGIGNEKLIDANPGIHQFSDEIINPTNTEKGYTIHTCIVCGYSYIDYVYVGQCGENCYWSFDTSTGLLKIYGSGELYDYYPNINSNSVLTTTTPWSEYEDKITKVEITDGITSIGNGTLSNLSNATNIEIPASITSIGDYAFWGCEELTQIKIPNNVKSIGYCAFENCSGLTSIVIPKGATNLGSRLFYGCNKLKNVLILSPIINIGEGTFFECNSLESITIPYGVKRIDDGAFYNCTNLTSVTIPKTVSNIGKMSFYGCSKIQSITIPTSVMLIDDSAFFGCEKLLYAYYSGSKSDWSFIKIGSNNTPLIGALTFHTHTYIDTIVPPTVTSRGYTLHKCSVCGDNYEDTYVDKLEITSTTVNKGEAKINTTNKLSKVSFTLKSSKKKVNLKWKKVKGAKGYTVYYKKSKKASWKKLKSLSSKKTSFVKKGLKKGKTYYFTVKAYKVIKGKKVYGKFVAKKVKVK